MKCKKCNFEIREGWDFCPKCGTTIAKAIIIPMKFNLDEDEDLEETFGQAFKEFDKIFKSLGFPGNINLTIKTERKPIKVKRAEAVVKESRIVKQVEEPETKIERHLDNLNIELKLPGITSIHDITIKKMNESIEIRAYSGDKMYFKVIPVLSNANITEKKFVSGILRLKIQK